MVLQILLIPGLGFYVLAYGIGKGAVAGGALVGMGALCFYGLGMGGSDTVLNNSL